MGSARQRADTAAQVVRDLTRWRGGEPSTARTYLAMRKFDRRTDGRSSQLALAALRAMRGSPDHGRAETVTLDPGWALGLEGLRADGVSLVPDILDADAIARLTAFARTAPSLGRSRSGGGGPATYDSRGPDDTVVEILAPFVLDNPEVQSVIAHPSVRELARRYFGIGAVIHPPQLYWSCAGCAPTEATEAELARKFHVDYDGIRGIRLHMYLTDVDADGAPMEYVQGSHRPGSRPGDGLRRADYGVDESAVWRTFPTSALRPILGPAGTSFVSDGQGLHRGTQPRSRDRLFLIMPLQATGFAGYQLGRRHVRPRDPAFAAALRSRRPEFRLFAEAG